MTALEKEWELGRGSSLNECSIKNSSTSSQRSTRNLLQLAGEKQTIEANILLFK